MLVNDSELRKLRARWTAGKYHSILNALKSVLPPNDWIEMCDTINHPAAKRIASDLRGIELCEMNLRDLDLGDSFLDFSRFDGSAFDQAQFQWSIMNHVSFRGCKFHLTQMIIVFGCDVDFSSATLEDAFIDHARFERCNFSSVNMRGGSIAGSSVIDSDFSGARIEGSEIKSSDARGGNFSTAKFVDCNLSLSILSGGCMSKASFENCDLSGVDFRGTNLNGVRFYGGTFGGLSNSELIQRTKFDDTPEARQAVAASDAEYRESIEWCPVLPQETPFAPEPQRTRLKGMPGETVPRSGWWTSPALGAKDGRQYFKAGERFPDTKMTDWGQVIWSYGENNQ